MCHEPNLAVLVTRSSVLAFLARSQRRVRAPSVKRAPFGAVPVGAKDPDAEQITALRVRPRDAFIVHPHAATRSQSEFIARRIHPHSARCSRVSITIARAETDPNRPVRIDHPVACERGPINARPRTPDPTAIAAGTNTRD